MNAIKTIFATLIFIAAANAQAVCVNPDGNLDDASLAYIAPIDMLPLCAAQAEPVKKVAVAAAPVAKVKAKAENTVEIPYVYGGGDTE